MDINKLKVLNENGYRVQKSCYFCEYSVFKNGNDYGECTIKTYFHLKHKKELYLSIHKNGVCDTYKESQEKTLSLEGFRQLL